MQVQRCLLLVPALRHMAIFCCGGVPPFASLQPALAANSVHVITVLLDISNAATTTAEGALVLRTAVAAAAERLPSIAQVLCGGNAPPNSPSMLLSSAATPHASGSAHSAAQDPAAKAPVEAFSESNRALCGARAAAEAAVAAAVESVLGMVPEAGEPLMGAGLTSAGAVRLVAALESALGRELPGEC